MAYVIRSPRRKLVARLLDWEQWITVHPNGKGIGKNGEPKKGTPVLIDDVTGEVKKGMGGKFNGRHISAARRHGLEENVGGQMVINAANAGHLQERYLGKGQVGLKGKGIPKPPQPAPPAPPPKPPEPEQPKRPEPPPPAPPPAPEPEPTQEQYEEQSQKLMRQIHEWRNTHPGYDSPPYELRIKKALIDAKRGVPGVQIVEGKYFIERGADGVHSLYLPSTIKTIPSEWLNKPSIIHNIIEKEKENVKQFKERMTAAVESTKTFNRALNIEDAEKEASRLSGAEYVAFGMMDLEDVNSCNQALHAALKKYPGIAGAMQNFGNIQALRDLVKKRVASAINDPKFRAKIEANMRPSFEAAFKNFRVNGGKGAVTVPILFSMLGILSGKAEDLKIDPPKKGEAADEFRERVWKEFIKNSIESWAVHENNPLIPKDTDNVYGYANQDGVYVSKAMREWSFRDNFRRDVASGFHPKGTQADPALSVIMHEMMHKVADFIDGDYGGKTMEFNDIYLSNKGIGLKARLSGYANTSVIEMLAEGGCEAAVSEKPRKIAQKILQNLDAAYQARVRDLEAAYEYYGRG